MEDLNAMVISALMQKGQKIVLAESCTAGLAAASLAAVPGASAVLWGAFVTYTLDAKEKMLGVAPALLAEHGAVSEQTARAMADGALSCSGADVAVSITGLAGPDGDGSSTPVGTVWAACRKVGEPARARRFFFEGNRAQIRESACAAALRLALEIVG
jgi:PncC family amidohydrolase